MKRFLVFTGENYNADRNVSCAMEEGMGMTKQEIFEKAVRGLASQGWQRSLDPVSHTGMRQFCAYDNGKGGHCAWGWVDEESWAYGTMAITGLNTPAAKALKLFGLTEFARRLQVAHDGTRDNDMRERFISFCDEFGLTWPADVVKE